MIFPMTMGMMTMMEAVFKLEFFIFFSTNLPPNAADIPKKNIAKLNANCTCCGVLFMYSEIGLTNNDHVYTEPIEQWISRAGKAPRIHLLLIPKVSPYFLLMIFVYR